MTFAARTPYFDLYSQEIDAGSVEEVEIDFAYYDLATAIGVPCLPAIRAIVTYEHGKPVFKDIWRVASGDQPYEVDIMRSEQPFAKALHEHLEGWLRSPEGKRVVDDLWDEAEEKALEDGYE